MAKHERDQRLLERRNAKIAARYYYWTEEMRMRSDDAIVQLSENEFFLAPETIIKILQRARSIGADELKKNMKLGRPKTIPPKITAEILAFMPDRIPTK